jgi:hypothetical protein
LIASTNHGRILHEGTGTGQIYYMRIAGFKQKKKHLPTRRKISQKNSQHSQILGVQNAVGARGGGHGCGFFSAEC